MQHEVSMRNKHEEIKCCGGKYHQCWACQYIWPCSASPTPSTHISLHTALSTVHAIISIKACQSTHPTSSQNEQVQATHSTPVDGCCVLRITSQQFHSTCQLDTSDTGLSIPIWKPATNQITHYSSHQDDGHTHSVIHTVLDSRGIRYSLNLQCDHLTYNTAEEKHAPHLFLFSFLLFCF